MIVLATVRLYSYVHLFLSYLFFYTDPATPDLSTLSLHDALPILSCAQMAKNPSSFEVTCPCCSALLKLLRRDRKSTRLNSSHRCISYAVFCLKKKKKTKWSRRACGYIRMWTSNSVNCTRARSQLF